MIDPDYFKQKREKFLKEKERLELYFDGEISEPSEISSSSDED